MPNKQKYIAITIGPVFSTMNLVTSPAALWASSYIFSYISKKICEILKATYNIAAKDIITPFADFENDCTDETKNLIESFEKGGVGLFHDRIIFRKGSFDVAEIKNIRSSVIECLKKDFKLDSDGAKEYLKRYLLIDGIEYEAENPILESAKKLDCLELSTPVAFEEDINPLLEVFGGMYSRSKTEYTGSKNKRILEIVQSLGISEWQLQKNANSIKSLDDIADTSGKNQMMKKHIYYAIIRADVDNMSKIIANLKNDEFNKFSLKCFRYCAEVAKKVQEYSGVTIFAGGDDLLALLPCETSEGKTVFEFVSDVQKIFNGENGFKDYIDAINSENQNKQDGKKTPVPTLSVGIYISYVKFPLYEAIEQSANLLFAVAKSKKNCVAINIQKHSGQSSQIVISNNRLNDFIKLQKSALDRVKLNSAEADENEKFLLSAFQKFALFSILFNMAKDTEVDNIFKNTFDSEDQKKFKTSINSMAEFYKALDNDCYYSTDDKILKNDNKAGVMEAVLRIIKFFTERKG